MNNTISIDPDKLFTKTAYHKETGLARATIDRYINDGKIKTIAFKGVTVIKKD